MIDIGEYVVAVLLALESSKIIPVALPHDDLHRIYLMRYQIEDPRRAARAQPAVELLEKRPPFARVIDRALEFKREDRYGSAAEMREDVRRAMAEMDGVARTEIATRETCRIRQTGRAVHPTCEAVLESRGKR